MEFMETVAVTVQTPYGANNSTLTPEALPTSLWRIDWAQVAVAVQD